MSASRSPRKRTCSGTRGNCGQPVHPPAGALPAGRERACAAQISQVPRAPGVTADGLARSSRPACRRSGPCCGSNGRKRWPEPARARIVAAELLDQLGAGTDDAVAALDAGLAGEPPAALARRLKGRPGVVIAVHDRLLPRGSGPWSRSQGGAAAASHFPADAPGVPIIDRRRDNPLDPGVNLTRPGSRRIPRS